MDSKFIVILLVLSLTSGNCGLLKWFNQWNENLSPENSNTKCREKRGAEENGIKAESTTPISDQVISLMDIEEGKLFTETENQTNSKPKRCPKASYDSFEKYNGYNPLIGSAKDTNPASPLVLVRRDVDHIRNKKNCNICKNQPACKVYKICGQCNRYCTNSQNSDQNNTIHGVVNPSSSESISLSNGFNETSDDFLSKTPYTIATLKEGETKNIICRIIGIQDITDIDTLTIWVTTQSNNPPKTVNDLTDQHSADQKPTDNSVNQDFRNSEHTEKQQGELPHMLPKYINQHAVPNPAEIRPRFSDDYDYEEDPTFPRISNTDNEDLKSNPDLIEGPPPNFVKATNMGVTDPSEIAVDPRSSNVVSESNHPIIVQPKEFESDESDELEDNPTELPTAPTSHTKKTISEEQENAVTSSSTVRPSIFNRLQESITNKLDRSPAFQGLRQADEDDHNSFDPKRRYNFGKNLFKLTQDASADKNKMFTPSQVVSSPFQTMMRNIERPSSNVAASQLATGTEDKFTQINEAIQEVKSMVKNIQEEASKSQEKRLLGIPHLVQPSEDVSNTIDELSNGKPVDNNPTISKDVVKNFKKVNQYFINRAQDALDMIGQHKKDNENSIGSPKEVTPTNNDNTLANVRDEHSHLTKKVITDLKKMPQFVLDTFQDGLKGIGSRENQPTGQGLETPPNVVNEGSRNENVELSQRFGEDSSDDDPDNLGENLTQVSKNEDNKQSFSSFTPPSVLDIEKPTTLAILSKLDKYLADVKERRQQKYSPEKFLKKANVKVTPPSMVPDSLPKILPEINSRYNVLSKKVSDSIIGSQNVKEADIEKDSGTTSSPIYDLQKQRQILRQKLRNFIDQIKTNKDKSLQPQGDFQIGEVTNGVSTSLPKPTSLKIPKLENRILSLNAPSEPKNVDGNLQDKILNIESPEDIIRNMEKPIETPFSVSENTKHAITTENSDQILGKQNDFRENKNNRFLPTTIRDGSNSVTTPPNNKLLKYLENFKDKQKQSLIPKMPLLKDSETSEKGLNLAKPSYGKTNIGKKIELNKDLPKLSVMKYLEDLNGSNKNGPIPKMVTTPNEFPNQLDDGSVPTETKNENLEITENKESPKTLLKDKLKNYVENLKNPSKVKEAEEMFNSRITPAKGYNIKNKETPSPKMTEARQVDDQLIDRFNTKFPKMVTPPYEFPYHLAGQSRDPAESQNKNLKMAQNDADEFKKNFLKDKLKKYVENLKKPMDSKVRQSEEKFSSVTTPAKSFNNENSSKISDARQVDDQLIDRLNTKFPKMVTPPYEFPYHLAGQSHGPSDLNNENLRMTQNDADEESNKDVLKNKLKKYVKSLKNPKKSKMHQDEEMVSPVTTSAESFKSENSPTFSEARQVDDQLIDRLNTKFPNMVTPPYEFPYHLAGQSRGPTDLKNENLRMNQNDADEESKKDVLKNKLKKYVKSLKNPKESKVHQDNEMVSPVTTSAESFKSENSPTFSEARQVDDQLINRLNTKFPNMVTPPYEFPYHLAGQSRGPTDLKNENLRMNQNDADEESKKDVLKNKLKKYVKSLKNPKESKVHQDKEMVSPVTTSAESFKSENSPTFSEARQVDDQLIDRLNTKFPNMVTPPYEFPYHLAGQSRGPTDLKNENLRMNQNDANEESKKYLLKNKLKEFVDSLKKPTESKAGKAEEMFKPRMTPTHELGSPNFNIPEEAETHIPKGELIHPKTKTMRPPSKIFPDLIRKTEDQKESLKALKQRLENLLDDRKPKQENMPPLQTSNHNEPEVTFEKQSREFNIDQTSPPNKRNMKKDISRPLKLVTGENVGERTPSNIDDSISSMSNENPEIKSQNVNMEIRNWISEDENPVDWSNNLGKIVQSSSKPTDVFFIGNGIKLPLQVMKHKDGSMDLSVDLDKLCSCKNTTCPKNHTAIEETVGAILEKEAELKDQLSLKNEENLKDDVKIEPVTPPSTYRNKPIIGNGLIINHRRLNPKGKNLQKRLMELNNVDLQKENSEVFKRSPNVVNYSPELTTLKTFLENFKKEQENIVNEVVKTSNLNGIELPTLPTLSPEIKSQIDSFGVQVQDTLTKSLNTLPKIENRFKDFNNNLIKNKNNLDKLLKSNMEAMELPKLPNLFTTKHPYVLGKSLPFLPKIENSFNELNDDLVKIKNAYQFKKVDALEKKLKELNNEVEKYNKNNEKLLAKETEKIFATHGDNKVVKKEMNIINNVLTWVHSLAGRDNKE